SLTTLAQVDGDVLYSVGRMSAWLIEPLIVALTLAYPHGRVEGRTDRLIVKAALATALVLYLPAAFIAPFPDPSAVASCGTTCPANAFQFADFGVAADVMRVLRETLSVLIFAAVAWSVALRARRSGPLMRTSLDAVGFVATMRAVSLAAYSGARAVSPE